MQALRPLTRQLFLVVTGLALVVATTAWLPAGTLEATRSPQLELTCAMDLCVVEASYVLPVRHDNHEVAFGWETQPAKGYAGNEPDSLRRALLAGIGEQDGNRRGYRYRVADVVWHSDIRCDDAVRVTMVASPVTTASVSADKSVPASSDGAFCSAYGIGG